jgi:hypothetical protein
VGSNSTETKFAHGGFDKYIQKVVKTPNPRSNNKNKNFTTVKNFARFGFERHRVRLTPNFATKSAVVPPKCTTTRPKQPGSVVLVCKKVLGCFGPWKVSVGVPPRVGTYPNYSQNCRSELNFATKPAVVPPKCTTKRPKQPGFVVLVSEKMLNYFGPRREAVGVPTYPK